MLLGILGDQHLTNHRPTRRIDDYWQTQLEKFEAELQHVKHCDAIFQVGDFFDSPYVANRVKATIIGLIKKHLNSPIYCIFGQHDISGHSELTFNNSPLAVLQAAGVVELLGNTVTLIPHDGEILHAFGASFGQPIPEPEDQAELNLLVTHQMIGDRPLYPGQELQAPKQFLIDNPGFKFVFCGDYHYRFQQHYQKRLIINPGALVRKSISEWDLAHHPAAMTVDTKTMLIEKHLLTIRPVNEVFDLNRNEEKDTEVLLKFIEALQAREGTAIGWKEILQDVLQQQVLQDSNNRKEIRKLIDEVFDQLEVQGWK